MCCIKTRFLSFFFFFVLMFSLAVPVVAAENPDPDISVFSSKYFTSNNSRISALGDGCIKIQYAVNATKSMTRLGPSTLTIYQENSPGNYTQVYKYSGGMYQNNVITARGSKTYQGIAGKRYYAKITYYASDGEGSETWTASTNIVTAT